MSACPWLVRYGADYSNIGYEVEPQGKPAPNAPYAAWYASTELIVVVPDSRFPIPDSLLPIPYSLFPVSFLI
ncbi:hypothetical protein BJP37_13590 [Moorena bouillonii PNG]|uniref:Uncharacterized protein n=2 Tax=Moorena TaxID=1155738 RepID=A0A1U7N1R5_9CYAN|nr:hypothetical protein BJP37_13590 [Moorena bouillonii PNG]